MVSTISLPTYPPPPPSHSTSFHKISINILSSNTTKFEADKYYTIPLIENIGKGTYSHVFKILDGKYVIKIMKPSYKKEDINSIRDRTKTITECKHFYIEENYREIDIIKTLIKTKPYPNNLVRILAYGQTTLSIKVFNKYFPAKCYIIIEKYYRSYTNYFKPPKKPSSIQLIKFIFDIKQAFKQLLQITRYIHLDPKLSNIYISNDGTKFLLSDFNLVQSYYSDNDRFKTYGNYYLHPRRICPLVKLPFYCLAITLLEIVYSKRMVYSLDKLQGYDHESFLQYIIKQYIKENNNNTSKSLQIFIIKCLNLKCKINTKAIFQNIKQQQQYRQKERLYQQQYQRNLKTSTQPSSSTLVITSSPPITPPSPPSTSLSSSSTSSQKSSSDDFIEIDAIQSINTMSSVKTIAQ